MVELMMAITIMVVAFLSLQAAIVSHSVMGRINLETNIALNEARAQIEIEKSQLFKDLQDGARTFDVVHGDHELNRIDANVPVGNVEVETVEGDIPTKLIRVTVTWRSANKRDRPIRLTTLVTEH